MTHIGFIGLGHMGTPMVQNLLKAGFKVKVYDIQRDAIDALTAEGATPANTLEEAVSDVDVIFTMLQTGLQVKNVCLTKDGIFSRAKKDVLYIDSSSIEITTTLELHTAAQAKNIAMIDAPVSGGVQGAKMATLTFMVGASQVNFERALPILKQLGKKIIHAGKPTNGQAAKICNNLILGISMIAVSEGFNLAEKLGLDAKTFFDISSNSSSQCWCMTNYCPVPGIIADVPANNGYKPGFMAKMMLKDLHLAERAAESVQAMIPLGAVATELYSLFVNQDMNEQDFSGIFQMISGKKSDENG